MNEMKKYQVFISSTYKDLINERNAVTQCLLDNDCIPVGMEQFPASNMSQMEYIKKMLQDCDYYILILAGRYGSEDDDGVGYTEKEYDYAISIGIPVMSFVIQDIGKLSLSQCESDRRLQKKLTNFRKKVCNGKLVRFYSNPDDLKGHVTSSINKCIRDFPARGWVRGEENFGITEKDRTPSEKLSNHQEDEMLISITRKDLIIILTSLYDAIIEYASGINNNIQEKVNEATEKMTKYAFILFRISEISFEKDSIEARLARETVDMYNYFGSALQELNKKRGAEDEGEYYATKQAEKTFTDFRLHVVSAIKQLKN